MDSKKKLPLAMAPSSSPDSEHATFDAEELPDEPRTMVQQKRKLRPHHQRGQEDDDHINGGKLSARPPWRGSAAAATTRPPPMQYDEGVRRPVGGTVFHYDLGDGLFRQQERGEFHRSPSESGLRPGAMRVRGLAQNESDDDNETAFTITGNQAPSIRYRVSQPNHEEDEAAIHAVVVDEIVATAEAADDNEEELQRLHKKLRLLVGIVVCAILVLVLILTIVLSVSRRSGSNPDPTPVPSPQSEAPTFFSPTSAPESFINELLLLMPSLDVAPYENPSSPQARAVDWVLLNNVTTDTTRSVQRFTLATLYYAMGGAGWDQVSNWLTNEHECTWQNILCDPEVVEVKLYNDGLAGFVPPEIGFLSKLTFLDLSHDEFGGGLVSTIPTEIGLLTELGTLGLAHQPLTGTIPSEIGLLTKLSRLWTYQNQFKDASIPTEIGGATSLTDLRLFRNNLTSSIPTEIANLINLESINVAANLLTGTLPAGMSKLTKLRNVETWGNGLEGVLPDLSNHTNLTSLLVWDTSVVGVVPPSLCRTLVDARVVCQNVNCSCCLDEDGNDCPVDLATIVLAIETGGVSAGPFADPTSSRSLALQWLLDDSYSSSLELNRRVQRYALAVLYYAMGGSDWNEATGWLNSTDECVEWNNLVCSSPQQEVVEVLLYDDGLVGTIPPDVALLSSLTFLDLTHSEAGGLLGGTIPTEFGLLTNLQELYLAFMSFTGAIPTEIGLLTNLNTFWGFQNRFSAASIPTEIGAATSLTDIRLFGNHLISTVPSEILNLSNLEALVISTNMITGTLPTGMSQMTRLTNINVWGNRLEGPMPELTGLTGLTSLLTWDTDIVGIVPSSLCPILDDVRVDCDRFLCVCCFDEDENECPPDDLLPTIGDSGISTVPISDPTSPQGKAVSWLLNETHSSTLSLERRIQRYALATIFYATGGETEWRVETRDNFLWPSDECQWAGGVTCSSENIVDRVSLFLGSLDGTIPDDIGLLTALTELDWQGNEVMGTIPTTIGLLTELRSLRFDENVMTGIIPTELGLCTNLTNLNADENQLGPYLPTELGLLVQMNYLSFEENNIASTIPSELALMTNLSLLELSGNLLTGTFPSELASLTALSYIDLFGNLLTGPLPDIVSWLEVETMSLEDAGLLTGTIPATISQLTKLAFLTLGKLELTGTIPTEIGLLARLEALSLSGNSFFQPTIPNELGNLTVLTALWINEAGLTGSLPSELGLLTALTTLHFSDEPNELVGSLPTEYCALTNLRFFGVRNNRLTGTIPTSLSQWSDLEVFYVPGNDLTGGIPTEIGLMTKLTTLILGENGNLGGHIPSEIGNLTLLGDLRVQENGHTGQVPTELATLTLLTWLSLAPNDVGGPLPDLSGLTNLEVMFLYDSDLTGTVPSHLCESLEVAQIDLGDIVCECCTDAFGGLPDPSTPGNGSAPDSIFDPDPGPPGN